MSTMSSFIGIFLKGFQQKNVIGGHLKTVFVTSYVMALFDVASVTFIVVGGWWIVLSSGVGASFGMLAAILLHDKIFTKGVN